MSTTRKLITDQIQAQMEQAAECVNEEQYGAAQIAFLECSTLCQQLEIERQLEQQTKAKKQLIFNIP